MAANQSSWRAQHRAAKARIPAYVERGKDAWRGYFEWAPEGRFVVEYAVRLNGTGKFTTATDARGGDVFARNPGPAAQCARGGEDAVTRWPLRRPRRWTHWLAATLAFAFVTLWIITSPPGMPSHAKVVRAWTPSEAWLYDRRGRLIDSVRVDFHARRLAWTPLDQIAPSLSRIIVQSEDQAVLEPRRGRLAGRRQRTARAL